MQKILFFKAITIFRGIHEKRLTWQPFLNGRMRSTNHCSRVQGDGCWRVEMPIVRLARGECFCQRTNFVHETNVLRRILWKFKQNARNSRNSMIAHWKILELFRKFVTALVWCRYCMFILIANGMTACFLRCFENFERLSFAIRTVVENNKNLPQLCRTIARYASFPLLNNGGKSIT